mgnify:CR=1 FL=1
MSKPTPSLTRLLYPFDKIPQISDRDLAYTNADERLQPFFKYAPNLDGFRQVLQDKQLDEGHRKVLVEVLQEQYEGKTVSALTQKRIEALAEERTFTVTTAHQPSLFTGPLYYIYKIISTLNLADQLQSEFPGYQFVPLFISGGEDHDFEEINHLHLFGKPVVWEREATGPVGELSLDGLADALSQVKEILGDSPSGQELSQLLDAAAAGKANYGAVARDLAHRLLGAYGLVILDPSHPKLKALFKPYIEKEIFDQTSKPLVDEAVKELEALGFSEQAFPREINFFYLGEGFRERIVQEGGTFQVLNQNISWTRTELQAEIEKAPERFSPNVVMRPIYQEVILPNLAYIGGGGEIAYWLERKKQFEAFSVNFPMLIRRNSVLFVDKGTKKRLAKLDLDVEDLFGDVEALIKAYIKANTENEISLSAEKSALAELFKKVEAKAEEVDPTLRKAAAAEGARQLNSLSQLEGKLMRAEKQRHDTAVNQMRKLKDKLFPNNGLQERYDNFMMYYLKYGRGFFDALRAQLDPLDPRFVVLIDE